MKTAPLKHLVTINGETLDDATDPEFEFRYIDIGSVRRGALLAEPEVLSFGQAPSRARRVVRAGDTLISTVRTYLRAVLPIREVSSPVIASTGFAVLTPGANVDPRYLGWLAQSDLVVEEVVARSVGVSYPAVNPFDIGTVRVPVLPLATQRAIADFLDAETARIDALIIRKRALIDQLKERRVVLTAHAVTGVANGTNCIPSGLPWAQFIRAGWRTAKLTLLARLGSGHTPSRDHPEWWVDCTIPWITTGEVSRLREDRIEYISETREKISSLGLANSSATLHAAETVVLSRTASPGYSAIMGTAMATSQDFVTWTCGPLLEPRFLLLCLRAMRGDLLGRLAQGSTHKTIYVPDIETIRIPLPPLDEQRRIANQTWAQLRMIDTAVQPIIHQIDLLNEHRQALITAAVTGDLDIRDGLNRAAENVLGRRQDSEVQITRRLLDIDNEQVEASSHTPTP
jgi:type I restriction enzyme, S subunit